MSYEVTFYVYCAATLIFFPLALFAKKEDAQYGWRGCFDTSVTCLILFGMIALITGT